MATLKQAAAAVRSSKGRDLSPKWDGAESMSSDQFSRHWRTAMEYYRLESTAKDLKPAVIRWMSDNEYSKADIAQFKKMKDWRCSITMGAIATCLHRGMPDSREDFNDGRKHTDWLKGAIKQALADGKNDIEEEVVETKVVGYQPSIQDRLREASYKMTNDIEEWHDEFLKDPETFDPKKFKVLNLLKGVQAKAAHARIIRDFYAKSYNEIIEVMAGKDEQLNEGYSCYTKKQIKKLHDFYKEILDACDMLGQEAKVNRKPRAKKAVPKDKLVAKLKFAKTNEPLKLVSINPADIVGAKELWIFNVKTRKIGKYVAEEYKELAIKGTTITNFSVNLSVQKTLRKPEEQLKQFKAAGKVQLRKFLDDIKAVDIKLNGRINEDTILLKVSN